MWVLVYSNILIESIPTVRMKLYKSIRNISWTETTPMTAPNCLSFLLQTNRFLKTFEHDNSFIAALSSLLGTIHLRSSNTDCV